MVSAEPAVHGRFVRTVVALTATVSLAVAAGSAYGLATYKADTHVGVSDICFGNCPAKNGQSPSPDVAVGPCQVHSCNYLLLGNDSRTGLHGQQLISNGTNAQAGAGHNADVIMVVHTQPTGKTVVLSFPRDLWVHIPGHGVGKINSSFAYGQAEGVARTIYQLTGLRISHYLYVDLAGFQSVVDTLGGVDMCIPPVDASPNGWITDPYTQLHIRPGCQRLNGQQALAYVRARHLPCDINGDFNRIARQQQFMRAIINRMLSTNELLHVTSLIKPILANMKRDPGLTIADLVSLVGELHGISTGDVIFRDVPSTPAVISSGGYPLDIVRLDKKPAELIFGDLRTNTPLPPQVGTALPSTPISEANITIPVVDHGSGGLTSKVEEILNLGGFDTSPGIVPYTGFGANVKGTVLAYTPAATDQADVLHTYFPNIKEKKVKTGALSGSQVALFITSAYKPVPVGAGVTFSACLPPAP